MSIDECLSAPPHSLVWRPPELVWRARFFFRTPLSNFRTPLRCPQGGAKIAQGGAKKNRARFAREISHPPEQIPETASDAINIDSAKFGGAKASDVHEFAGKN